MKKMIMIKKERICNGFIHLGLPEPELQRKKQVDTSVVLNLKAKTSLRSVWSVCAEEGGRVDLPPLMFLYKDGRGKW